METLQRTYHNILKYEDNPVVKEIIQYFKKNFKDSSLERVNEEGDVYSIDVRTEIKSDSSNQVSRENAKERAYQIKRELEGYLMKKFNLPAMSIQGVRGVNTKEGAYVEFAISFIYANKENFKPMWENKQAKVKNIIESVLLEIDKESSIKFIKEKLEKLTNKKVIFREEKTPHQRLEEEMKEWGTLKKDIEKHQKAFEDMIADKLKKETTLQEKIFNIMEQFSIKTKQVDDIVAAIKAGGQRTLGPTPTEKVAILMSKLNDATKLVVEKEFITLSKQVPFAPSKSIKFKEPKEEAVRDVVKKGIDWVKTTLGPLFSGIKQFTSTVDELKKTVESAGLQLNIYEKQN